MRVFLSLCELRGANHLLCNKRGTPIVLANALAQPKKNKEEKETERAVSRVSRMIPGQRERPLLSARR